MNPTSELVHFAGQGLRKAGRFLVDWRSLLGIWFDVGAFRCDHTYSQALYNPSLCVFAFEPNLQLATMLFGTLPNIAAFPMAVSETDGWAEFNTAPAPASRSLLAVEDANARQWVGGQGINVVSRTIAPTVRLDTFINLAGIQTVDYLKIDPQGADLFGVKSPGDG